MPGPPIAPMSPNSTSFVQSQSSSRMPRCRCSTPLAFMLSLLGKDLSQGLLTRLERDRRRQIRRLSGRFSHQSCTSKCFHAAQMRWNYARDEPATVSDVDDLPCRSSLDHFRRVLLQSADSYLIPCHVRQCSTTSSTTSSTSSPRRLHLNCRSHAPTLRRPARFE